MTDLADVVRQFAPYGIPGLVLVTILLMAVLPSSESKRVIIIIAMALVASIYVFEKWWTERSPSSSAQPIPTPPSGARANLLWADSGLSADWTGNDSAYTQGSTPKYVVKDMQLCDEPHANSVAICWTDNPTGYPPNKPPNDLTTPNPPQWCTYKSKITLATPSKPAANPNRVYVCARVIDR